ncbi:hypothetical protein [Streptomyces telluris]|nr:hypothetical protein [Streptomyces telluris]
MQEAAGAGFLLYCASAFVIIAVKLWFAVRAATMDHSPGGRP